MSVDGVATDGANSGTGSVPDQDSAKEFKDQVNASADDGELQGGSNQKSENLSQSILSAYNSRQIDNKLISAHAVIDNGLTGSDHDVQSKYLNLLGMVELKNLGQANGYIDGFNTDDSTKNLLKFYASVTIGDAQLNKQALPDHHTATISDIQSAYASGVINDQEEQDLLLFSKGP